MDPMEYRNTHSLGVSHLPSFLWQKKIGFPRLNIEHVIVMVVTAAKGAQPNIYP